MDRSLDGRWDVLVIGAGQAGLALARLLAGCGVSFLVVDAVIRIGSRWRGRWHYPPSAAACPTFRNVWPDARSSGGSTTSA